MPEIRQDALFRCLLGLGDNALILSQRLGALVGHCPVLEEELANANVSLDLLGQARLWLSYAAEIEGLGRTEDDLAFSRDAGEFRNVLLVEQPNGSYADTIARQFYFDAWHDLHLRRLAHSENERMAGIAAKASKEVSYHLQRSSGWVISLGDGTAESHERMQEALSALWMFTGELFEDIPSLRGDWLAHVTATFASATLALPADTWMQSGGKAGRHTENLGYILAEMQHLRRAFPGCHW